MPILPTLTKREAAGIDVHFCHANELEWGGKAEGRCEGAITEEVRELVPLFQLIGGIIQHPPVEVAGLLDLEFVDVTAQAHKLPSQLLVLETHFHLEHKNRKGMTGWQRIIKSGGDAKTWDIATCTTFDRK